MFLSHAHGEFSSRWWGGVEALLVRQGWVSTVIVPLFSGLVRVLNNIETCHLQIVSLEGHTVTESQWEQNWVSTSLSLGPELFVQGQTLPTPGCPGQWELVIRVPVTGVSNGPGHRSLCITGKTSPVRQLPLQSLASQTLWGRYYGNSLVEGESSSEVLSNFP
jgi:hypothetical protein